VHRAAPPGLRVLQQPKSTEVELALNPRLAVRNPHRPPPPAEPASLDREPLQRPRRHHHPRRVRLTLHNTGTFTHRCSWSVCGPGVTVAGYRAALLASHGGSAVVLADATGGSGVIDPGRV